MQQHPGLAKVRASDAQSAVCLHVLLCFLDMCMELMMLCYPHTQAGSDRRSYWWQLAQTAVCIHAWSVDSVLRQPASFTTLLSHC